MLTSGLTQEEIAAIQAPYVYIPRDEPRVTQREDIEARRLQSRFRQIERQLRRSERASLDRAVERLLRYRASVGVDPLLPITLAGRGGIGPMPPVAPVLIAPVNPAVITVAMHRPIDSPIIWRPGMPQPH
jgi:hypothetical protein